MTATANNGETYWFRRPSALFYAPSVGSAGECDEPATPAARLRNTFVPDGTLGWTSPTNVNRLTRIALIVAIVLAIVFRSWWPIAIGAGGVALVLLIAYGLQVQEERERRRQRQQRHSNSGNADERQPLRALDESGGALPVNDVLSESAAPGGAASIFFPPEFPPTLDEPNWTDDQDAWATSSYVPNAFNPRFNPVERCDRYPQCGPGGPQACAGPCTDPRADIPNPSRHNRYEKVDARYNLSEMKPQPVAAIDNAALLASEHNRSNNQAEPVVDHPLRADSPDRAQLQQNSGAQTAAFGVDPRSVSTGQLTSNYRRPQSLSATYMAPLRSSDSGPTEEQPRTQTDKMLQQMYMDKNELFWDEMVAKRAPTWRQNPNDPRNRLAMQQKEIERQSYRGLQWSQGP